MTLLLTGISNENEFYTNYYMSEVLETDLKELSARWRSDTELSGVKAPPDQLRAISDTYFRFKNMLKKESDPNQRLALHREFSSVLLKVLGYNQACTNRTLEDGKVIPLLTEVTRSTGEPDVWILEAFSMTESADGTVDSLASTFSAHQFQPLPDPCTRETNETLEDLVSKQIFSQAEPPRWVIIVSDRETLLIDRSKWNDQRLLRFDLEEILARREASTLAATCVLLHHDSITSKQGQPLLDSLDEKSHKHSQAVTQDLKYALQKCIEIIGNEVIYYLRTTSKEKIYEREIEKELTVESLRFMYRLLFILYIESRDELGYAPMKSDAYRLGCSFESLRDLEVLELTEEDSRTGYYIHDSIKLLFDLIYSGYPEHQQLQDDYRQLFISYAAKASIQDNPDAIRNFGFDLFPLRSHLFDPSKTPMLNKVRLRNDAMLQVLKLMSLSKAKGNKHRSGRISYAQLGINQLGAVYEALLCFKGFFAEEDLFEVQPAPKKSGRNLSGEDDGESDFDEEDDPPPQKSKAKAETKNTRDALEIAYLVPKDELEKYAMDERVFDENGKQKFYAKGSFIYRLAGRDRQKSASYYTPEVLTQCLVKYSLKELLKEKSADDILNLKVCEPAMGSAAFLNECVNQLADAYLERKQNELARRIPHDEYSLEKQKVKMFIADRNVFGVDLNPVAVELAEVSLWLNSIYEGAFVPWFGMQLVCGNSLVGAHRQTFSRELLSGGRKGKRLWYESEPKRIIPGSSRAVDDVYQFLLPDPGMSKYDDKTVKELAKDRIKRIDTWRTAFCKPLTEAEERTVLDLSAKIDELWKQHSDKLRAVRENTTDPLTIFGREENNLIHFTLTEQKDELFKQQGLAAEISSSSAYSRLKLVMDYWCALWFWPIVRSDQLPTRAEFFADIATILSESNNKDRDEQAHKPDRLDIVHNLVNSYRFLHWELEFADIFDGQGGFDLVIGNPPWIRFEWEESGVLGDFDPRCVVKKIAAPDLAKERNEIIGRYNLLEDYLAAYEESDATQGFVSAVTNYSTLKGVQSNSYKCFMVRAWEVSNSGSVVALVHPPGVFDDPKGAGFRNEIYKRLKLHFRFRNALMLFPIKDTRLFSLNVYGAKSGEQFSTIANLFHPKTIDACFEHAGEGSIPGIKDERNKLELCGHRHRIISGQQTTLNLFAKLYDGEGTPPNEARLPSLHSMSFVQILEKFAAADFYLRDAVDDVFTTVFWDETNSRRDGTIKRDTKFVDSPTQFVYSGPHFHVGNSLWKTPRRVCTEKAHYDPVDLEYITHDYLPRTNYVPGCSNDEYEKRTPETPEGKRVTDYYRLLARKMLSGQMERTLISCIIPRKLAHTNAAISLCFRDDRLLLRVAAQFFSVPFDFFIKVTGKSNLYHETLMTLPICKESVLESFMIARVLGLSCITGSYQDLWHNNFDSNFLNDRWTNQERKSNLEPYFDGLSKQWNVDSGLRSDLARRQALVELDVLIALAFNMSYEELCDIYRIQFPVLRSYERETFYDQTGRIIFTNNKGLSGVGLERKSWEEIRGMQKGTHEIVIEDDTMPDGLFKRTIAYQAPFFSMNREQDYADAWKEFSSRLGIGNSALIHKDEKMSSII